MGRDIDGGPAFPRTMGWNGLTDYEEHRCSDDQTGMTLRDWFAGQALAGILAATTVAGPGESASRAYGMADAMLAERAKEAT